MVIVQIFYGTREKTSKSRRNRNNNLTIKQRSMIFMELALVVCGGPKLIAKSWLQEYVESTFGPLQPAVAIASKSPIIKR